MTTAPHRLGAPHPLAQHIAQTISAYQAALAAAAAANSSDFPWHPALNVTDLPPPDLTELAAEIAHRLGETLRGLSLWQAHPYRRGLETAQSVWQQGSTRLLDYSPPDTPKTAPTVIVLPSLVNRAYILDLAPAHSAMARLAAAGLRPYLLDWGVPQGAEAGFTLSDYAGRVLDAINDLTDQPVALLGYCMGGTMATGIAAQRPDRFNALVTLGAPWDFSISAGVRQHLQLVFGQHDCVAAETALATMARAFGHIPAVIFHALFAAINPMEFATKFRRFAQFPADSPAVDLFVAVEDWLADGVPMSAPAVQDLLVNWHIRNTPHRKQWQFLGAPVCPEKITCPTLVIAGETDTIAPADGVLALKKANPSIETHLAPGGHVGMIISDRVADPLWHKIAAFIRAATETAAT